MTEHRPRRQANAHAGHPPHITVLYPFLTSREIDDEVVDVLRDTLSAIPSFRFVLARTGRFDKVLYLAPVPAEPFRALTRTMCDRWPQHPPYGGAHVVVTPHLTVRQGVRAFRPEAEIDRQLPISAIASEVWLLTQRWRGRWSVRATFPLGPP